jgi:hypothetical protein
MDNIGINKLLNALQRQSTAQIQQEEVQFERNLRKEANTYLLKLNRIDVNTKCRGQIQSYSFDARYPNLKDSIAKAEMLIADPYFDEIFKK